MEKNEVQMHSDFVVGDDESVEDGEGAEHPSAVYARQMGVIDDAREERPDSVVQREPTSDNERCEEEAMEAAQTLVAAAGPSAPPEDHIPMDEQRAASPAPLPSTFDELADMISTPEIDRLLNPPTYDGHD